MAHIVPVRQTRKFRLKVLACLLNPEWMLRYGPIIKPEYFEMEDEHDVCAAILAYRDAYRVPPKDAADLLALLDGEHGMLVHTLYVGLLEWDLRMASDVIIQFAKEQAAKLAVLESMGDIEQGQLEAMMARLKSAMRVGEDLTVQWLDIKKDVDVWMHQLEIPKVPTGMLHLDMALKGGLGAGELGVILAPPNYGKSMALVNIGVGAAGPLYRGHVAHFTCEISAAIVAKRYAARCVFAFPNPDGGDSTEYKRRFERAAALMIPGTVHVYDFQGTVEDLDDRLEALTDQEGWKPDLIIVDHSDMVKATRSREDRYTELGDIFQGLRDMVGPKRWACPLWTATQTGRQALNKEVITMRDLAESFRKAHVADVIAALCQTVEEEASDQCRIFLAKVRDGKSRDMIRAHYRAQYQAIITTGFVKPEVEE